MSYIRESRPKLGIPLTRVDRIVIGVGIAALLVVVLLPIYAWSGLPDRVPIHFGFDGQPTTWGDRAMVWTLPVVALAICIPMYILSRFPHIFNYPWVITEENAPDLYRLSRSMILWLTMEMALMFVAVQWGAQRMATGDDSAFVGIAVGLSMVVIFGTMVYFLVVSSRYARPNARRNSSTSSPSSRDSHEHAERSDRTSGTHAADRGR